MIPLYKFHRDPVAVLDWDQKYRSEGAPTDDPNGYRMQPFVQTILRHLAIGSLILDAGCGTGSLLRFLKQRGGDVAGVDSSPTAIATLKRVAPEIPAQVASIEQLPFPDASFDAYLAIGSWEYPPGGPKKAASEAVRVLQPGGLAFIEVPHVSVLRRLAYVPLKQLESLVHTSEVGKKHFGSVRRFSHYLFSASEMHDLLRRQGFTVLETQPHDLPEPTRHYGLWVDWPFLRGGPKYELNAFGRLAKSIGNALSPWTIATGMFIVARKQ